MADSRVNMDEAFADPADPKAQEIVEGPESLGVVGAPGQVE